MIYCAAGYTLRTGKGSCPTFESVSKVPINDRIDMCGLCKHHLLSQCPRFLRFIEDFIVNNKNLNADMSNIVDHSPCPECIKSNPNDPAYCMNCKTALELFANSIILNPAEDGFHPEDLDDDNNGGIKK